MQTWRAVLLVVLAGGLTHVAASAAEPETTCPPPEVLSPSGWCFPKIEVEGRLAQIFEFSDCEWISGLSCKLVYNQKAPFPSRVFFVEYDSAGRLVGKRTRLLFYMVEGPARVSGAMFRLRARHTSCIVVRGEWDK